MLVTTYQHDYIPPYTRRYDFVQKPLPGASKKDRPEEECQCIEESRVEPPKAVLDKCPDVEWTGIAPMGRLVEPRIIPTKFSNDQMDAMARDPYGDCFKNQPNRFLQILRTAYPDLYERLKQMPKDELNRRMDNQRLITTYQIDYCNVNEFPEGVYESLKPDDETSKLNANKLLHQQGPCAEFRANVMQELDKENADSFNLSADSCDKAYKPFKITFADSSRFISSGGYSHWRTSGNAFAKRANFSEYMDTISKNGCVVMKNNIHDHRNCANGKHCMHKIIYTCTNLK